MIITQTPLRISFFGGGTDFKDYYRLGEGGAVLSTAIDKCIYVIIKKRFDDKIYINYSRKEIIDSVDEIRHDLVRETMRKTGIDKGVEITTLADVPSEGTGLGSSGSVTVGLLNTFYLYQVQSQSAAMLARQACEIEIDILERPIGKQDQYSAAFGNLNLIKFNPDDTVILQHLSIDEEVKRELEANLMLIYTGITRRSSDILSEQKKNIKDKISVLNDIRDMVEEGKECLIKGKLDEFGRLLHQGWELKKKLAQGINNPRIEEIYQAARKAGALGGKISGAGGGGFLLLYCPVEQQSQVRKALRNLRELPFRFEEEGTKAIFNVREG
ncbi:MAG: GHMP kinase [Clostridia bacterium]|jgi:D-glycero-alpha-D-manno-heptose-7-phosphate kinase|nr:GHMP kinase [Clostridia bacterium]